MLRMGRAMVLAGLGLLLGPPALAQYPQDAASAGVSDSTVEAGQRVTLGGDGWQPGSTVKLRWSRVLEMEVIVGQQGEFSAVVTVPAEIASGEHYISASGRSGQDEPSQVLVRMLVSGSTKARAGSEVAFSPAKITVWALMAVGLFLVGLAAVVVGRRRPSEPN
jgi:hypothetical protein